MKLSERAKLISERSARIIQEKIDRGEYNRLVMVRSEVEQFTYFCSLYLSQSLVTEREVLTEHLNYSVAGATKSLVFKDGFHIDLMRISPRMDEKFIEKRFLKHFKDIAGLYNLDEVEFYDIKNDGFRKEIPEKSDTITEQLKTLLHTCKQ